MKPEDEEPIDREAWRRKLGDAGAPPEATDIVIRAEARRAVAKPARGGRWTLPASLAAALVLAVALTQWQVEDERLNPLVDETQVLPRPAAYESAPAAAGPAAEAPAADAAMEAQQESHGFTVPAPMLDLPAREESARSPPPPPAENDAGFAATPSRERADLPEAKADAAAVQPPPPAAAPKQQKEPGDITVTGSRAASDQENAERAQGTPTTGIAPMTGELGKVRAKQEPGAPQRSPEQWYAEIEALRADGRDEEADAELEKLEAAHPGWLEKNHP